MADARREGRMGNSALSVAPLIARWRMIATPHMREYNP
jgi:hypothetical protein